MVPKGNAPIAESRRRSDENQRWLRYYIGALDSDGLGKVVSEHPIAGPLTVEQAVPMNQFQIDDHIHQIRRLLRLTIALPTAYLIPATEWQTRSFRSPGGRPVNPRRRAGF